MFFERAIVPDVTLQNLKPNVCRIQKEWKMLLLPTSDNRCKDLKYSLDSEMQAGIGHFGLWVCPSNDGIQNQVARSSNIHSKLESTMIVRMRYTILLT